MKDGHKRYLARLAPRFAVELEGMAKLASDDGERVGPHTMLREIAEHVLAREHLKEQVVKAIERRRK